MHLGTLTLQQTSKLRPGVVPDTLHDIMPGKGKSGHTQVATLTGQAWYMCVSERGGERASGVGRLKETDTEARANHSVFCKQSQGPPRGAEGREARWEWGWESL